MGEVLPKLIFIGDSGVGKTSIAHRIITGDFDETAKPTIGALSSTVERMLNGQPTKFMIWDTAGQEMYRSVVPLYFKDATCAVIVFSLDDSTTRQHIPGWIDFLNQHSQRPVPVVIVGNKIDMATDEEILASEAVRNYAAEINANYFETSAKTGQGVNNMIDFVLEEYIIPKTGGHYTRQAVTLEIPPGRKQSNCC